MYSPSFYSTINFPTRITTTSETLKDNILQWSHQDYSFWYYRIIHFWSSSPVFNNLKSTKKSASWKENEVHSYCNYDKEMFSTDLASINTLQPGVTFLYPLKTSEKVDHIVRTPLGDGRGLSHFQNIHIGET